MSSTLAAESPESDDLAMRLGSPTVPFHPCLALLFLAAACGSQEPEPSVEGRELGDGYAELAEEGPPPTVEVPDDAPLVLFLGDSLTAGLHLSVERAWPAALQRTLASEGVYFRVQNAGVSGDTSAGGLSRANWVLKSEPDIVVIELGPNDGLRGIDLVSTEANLRALIERVSATGARPLLLGMNVPTNLGEYAEDFAAIYPRLADELDVPLLPRFLDGVGGVPEMNLPDGLHPTPEGHKRLARNASEALRGLLERLTPGQESR